jgi:putative heme-binding domain-containing protein
MKLSALILWLVAGSFALTLDKDAKDQVPKEPASKDMVATLTAEDIAQGKKLFVGHCAYCHAMGGTGDRGPSLTRPDLLHAPNNEALFKLIQSGIDGSEMPAAWQMTDHEIWQVAGYVRSLGRTEATPLPGDPTRGKSLFEAKGCSSCHIVNGGGSALGPDLTNVGARRSPAYLLNVLTDPGSKVPEGFLMVRVTTSDGRPVEGIRLNEDTFTIQIRDLANKVHSFRKSELVELKKEFGKSPMPSFKTALQGAEMDDLVAYMSSLRGHR